MRYITQLDNPGWNTKEFQNAKEFTELSVNVMSHLAEMPGVVVDIPSAFAVSPVETTIGLLKFIPEEFNNLVIASNVLDVLNPFLGLIGKEYSQEELNNLSQLNYNELATEIIFNFCSGEIKKEELSSLIQKSYSSFKDKEIFTLDESIKHFNLEGIGKYPSKIF